MPIPSAKTCQICSKPLTMHERFAGSICSDWRCRWRSLDAQLETHRSETAAALGEKSAASFPITVVPFHTRPTVPVAEEERQELLAFLQGLLQEISSHEHVAPAAPTDPGIGSVRQRRSAQQCGRLTRESVRCLRRVLLPLRSDAARLPG